MAEREGRYGFRRARRGPSVGHSCSVGLIVRSAPVHNLLPHTHFRHSYTPPYIIPLRTTKSSEIVSRNGISLSLHPASFASVAQSARRRPPSALSSSAASSASSSHDAHSARTVPGVLHFCPALWCQCLRELWHSVPSPSQCQVHGRHSRSQASQCLDHRRHSSAQCPGYTRHSSVSDVQCRRGIESVKMNTYCSASYI